jgi:hypothetical protein
MAACAVPGLVWSTTACFALDVSALHQPVLPSDVSALQQSVLPSDVSALKQSVLSLDLYACHSTAVCTPGDV